jgi:uncharacterized membrane protein
MRIPFRTSVAAHTVLAIVSGGLSLLIIAAPYLAARSHPAVATFVYLLFAPVCHQSTGRSFALDGYSWAVCHRCTGIYLGIFLASLLPPRLFAALQSSLPRRIWVVGATVPLVLDALLPIAGFWTNTPWSRFSSGLLFGTMLSTLLLPGIMELLNQVPWQRTHSHASVLDGGSVWTRNEC